MNSTPNVFDHWGPNIAEARRAKAMTQDTLAAELGVAPMTVSRWETGPMKPSLTMQGRIAAALDASVSGLFPRTDAEAALAESAAELESALARTGNGCS